MGLMVNQSLDDMKFADILEELKLGDKDDLIHLTDDIKNRLVLLGMTAGVVAGIKQGSPAGCCRTSR